MSSLIKNNPSLGHFIIWVLFLIYFNLPNILKEKSYTFCLYFLNFNFAFPSAHFSSNFFDIPSSTFSLAFSFYKHEQSHRLSHKSSPPLSF